MSVAARPVHGTSTIDPLTFLARLAHAAVTPDTMASLGFQLSSAITQLGTHLRVRGDESLEQHYAAALVLACFEPVQNDIKAYEAVLLMFLRYDRRAPNLPPLVPAGRLRIQKARSLYFIQHMRDQRAFQPMYLAARQIDAYGVRSQSPRKPEHVILLSRELSGGSLLVPLTAPEQLYLSLSDPGPGT